MCCNGIYYDDACERFLSMLPGMSLWTNALQGSIVIIAVIVNILTQQIAEKHVLHSRVI